ncbi:MAG TPA: aminoglycoside adenylyltransferase family protein [Clostridia bacterium]|nr:aminoglycoside adenylyltransferase family protein [Clostridia bacterium]
MPVEGGWMSDNRVPKEAARALSILEALLGSSIVALYLYGSAVDGGLRNNSDVDVLAVVRRGLTDEERRTLIGRLMLASGKMGNADSARPLEVTLVKQNAVVPWKYPPHKEFIYGEWLRASFEQGWTPEPAPDPDLAIILTQIRSHSIALAGLDASEFLDPVPMADIRRAMKDCLPDLMRSLKGDERNVLLTLARMWVTAAAGEFLPKDEAAGWALARLPKEDGLLLELAAKAYRGEAADAWENLDRETAALANRLKKEVELCLE